MSKKPDFQQQQYQQQEEEQPSEQPAQRESEVKPLRPFNLKDTKNSKPLQQDPLQMEEEDPDIQLRKFPEQSGRRTPYNMGPR